MTKAYFVIDTLTDTMATARYSLQEAREDAEKLNKSHNSTDRYQIFKVKLIKVKDDK